MDTIRTLYVSADQATKKGNTYNLDITGGISAPAGARVFVDNIAMTNNVCDEVTDDDKWVYLKPFDQVDVPDVRESTLGFAWNGGPARNLLQTTATCKQQPYWATMARTAWTHGATNVTFTVFGYWSLLLY